MSYNFFAISSGWNNKQVSRRRLASGGAIIAIVGGDGAGKTTVVAELSSWLSKDFDVLNVLLGKPNWSWTTKFVRRLLKIGRLLTSTPFVTDGSVVYEPDAKVSGFATYFLSLRSVCLGRDRYLAHARARRLATNGGLVICDRFPLSQVKMMDAPQIEHILPERLANQFLRYLILLEKHYFQFVLRPIC